MSASDSKSQGASPAAPSRQFSQLVGLGVELYQGYLFHRPQPADALDAILVPSSEIMVS